MVFVFDIIGVLSDLEIRKDLPTKDSIGVLFLIRLKKYLVPRNDEKISTE